MVDAGVRLWNGWAETGRTIYLRNTHPTGAQLRCPRIFHFGVFHARFLCVGIQALHTSYVCWSWEDETAKRMIGGCKMYSDKLEATTA